MGGASKKPGETASAAPEAEPAAAKDSKTDGGHTAGGHGHGTRRFARF